MLPYAVIAGVGYSDYWKMTPGEIFDVLQANAKIEKRRFDEKLEFFKKETESAIQNAAFTAFWGGYYSRPGVKMPKTVVQAFPGIFGRTSSGQISAENWQASERALLQYAAAFKANKANEKAVKK